MTDSSFYWFSLNQATWTIWRSRKHKTHTDTPIQTHTQREIRHRNTKTNTTSGVNPAKKLGACVPLKFPLAPFLPTLDWGHWELQTEAMDNTTAINGTRRIKPSSMVQIHRTSSERDTVEDWGLPDHSVQTCKVKSPDNITSDYKYIQGFSLSQS